MDYLMHSMERGRQGLYINRKNLAKELAELGFKEIKKLPSRSGFIEHNVMPVDYHAIKIIIFKNNSAINNHNVYIYDNPEPQDLPGDEEIVTLQDADTSNMVTHGFDGNDKIYGNEGRNILMGDKGDDMLFGRGGDDVLDGGPGVNELYGGPGDDMYTYSSVGLQKIYDCEGENIIMLIDRERADLRFHARSDGSALYYYEMFNDENKEIISNGIFIKNHINPECRIYKIADRMKTDCVDYAKNIDGVETMFNVSCEAFLTHSEL